jgi:hypothetical protein
MSIENPLWGAPRIRGELLMLGVKVAQSTGRRTGSPSCARARKEDPGTSLLRRQHRPILRRHTTSSDSGQICPIFEATTTH